MRSEGDSLLTNSHGRLIQTFVASVLVVVVAACEGGEGSGDTIGFTTGADTTSTAVVTTAPSDATTTTASTTTTTAPGTTTSTSLEPLDQLLETDFGDLESIPSGDIATGADAILGGSADYRTAESIASQLADAGIDLAGIEIWVWPVTGSDGVLLVMDIDNTAEGLLADPSGTALLTALASVPETAGITRFVMNYSAEDDSGPFVLTMTVSMDALMSSVADDTDISDQFELQVIRTATP